MSTKFVPLTTRPLSTSRQGITRFSSPLCDTGALLEELLRLRDGEPLLIQGLAGDDSREVHEPELLQRAQVVERRDAPRVDEASPDRLGDRANLVDVGPVQHPVAV